jgi:hypothetical protein
MLIKIPIPKNSIAYMITNVHNNIFKKYTNDDLIPTLSKIDVDKNLCTYKNKDKNISLSYEWNQKQIEPINSVMTTVITDIYFNNNELFREIYKIVHKSPYVYHNNIKYNIHYELIKFPDCKNTYYNNNLLTIRCYDINKLYIENELLKNNNQINSCIDLYNDLLCH